MNHDLNLPGYEEFLAQGLAALPDDADKSENSFAYPILSATALQIGEAMIKAQFIYSSLFAENLTGSELDAYVGDKTSLVRRKATRTKGEVTFTGTAGTYVDQGVVVGVGAEGKRFYTLYGDVIETDTVTIPVESVDVGYIGYIGESAVDTLISHAVGVSAVTNAKAMQSGVDEESDKDFYQRYKWHLRNFPYNLNHDTLVEWSSDIEGVGQIRTVGSKGSNTVTVYALDTGFEPSSEELNTKLQAMYNDRIAYGYNVNVASPTKEFVPVTIKVKQSDPTLATKVKDALVRYIKTYVDPRWVRTDLSIWEVINVVEKVADMDNINNIIIGNGSPVYSLSATDGSKLLAIGDVTAVKG